MARTLWALASLAVADDVAIERGAAADLEAGQDLAGGTGPGGGDPVHQTGGGDTPSSPGQTREQEVSLCQASSERAQGEAVLRHGQQPDNHSPGYMYRDDMGELVAARCHMWAWGSDTWTPRGCSRP